MLKYVPILLLAVVLISCGDDSDPVNTQTDTFIQPKEGSFFNYDEYNIDTIKSERIPTSTDTSTETFVKTGMTYMGKTNVSMIVTSNKYGLDTSYFNYESNNDVSYNATFGDEPAKWYTVPLFSKTTTTKVVWDTTNPNPQQGEATHSSGNVTISYIGNEAMIYKGQSVNVLKIKQIITFIYVYPNETETYTINAFAYYAPSLGYFLKREIPVMTNENGEKEDGNVSNLVNHHLQ